MQIGDFSVRCLQHQNKLSLKNEDIDLFASNISMTIFINYHIKVSLNNLIT